MKGLRFSLFLALLILETCGGIPARSLLSIIRANNPTISILAAGEACKNVLECADCTTAKICRPQGGGFVEIARKQCNGNTPHCNNNVCSATPSSNCTANDFSCPAVDGTYPDPSTCYRYHICVQSHRTTNQCPRNNVYDHGLGSCKLLRASTDCVNFNCARGKDGQFVVYPKDDRIYAICVDNQAYILGKCNEHEKFDISQGRCVRVCRKVEKQPTDDGDCQKFVLCAEVSRGVYEPTIQNCGFNQGFDEKLKECVENATCLQKNSESAKDGNGSQGDETKKPEDEAEKSEDEIKNPGEATTKPDDETPKPTEKLPPPVAKSFLVSIAGDNNRAAGISNGNDRINGDVVNGNDNGKQKLSPFFINNSGRDNSNDNASNGDDDINGNVVNGKQTGNNSNSAEHKKLKPFLISIAGNGNGVSSVSNGDDNINGDVVNGNDNGNEVKSPPAALPFIINNSGNSHGGNNVANGNDDTDGNVVNGNEESNSERSGNVGVIGRSRRNAEAPENEEHLEIPDASVINSLKTALQNFLRIVIGLPNIVIEI